jgi:hypothetical protein
LQFSEGLDSTEKGALKTCFFPVLAGRLKAKKN